jgi:HEAT repeat protein
MPARRRTAIGVAGVLSLAVVIGLAVVGPRVLRLNPPGRLAAANFSATTPLPELIPALRDSDGRALTALFQRLSAKTDASAKAIADGEAEEWFLTLAALRTGYLKFGGYGRAMALNITTKVLDRFTVVMAPASWVQVLPPARDLLASGLNDADPNVRASALDEVGRIWGWWPGRTPIPLEIAEIDGMKDGLLTPVLRCLAERSPKVRTRAVACLGLVPIDAAAAPAIPYLEDMGPDAADVRRQVLSSFARRRGLLTEDMILKRLYDPAPGIPEMAEVVLKTRGLNEEQISLGKMMFHPRPALRASLITLLRDRNDIDPVVWLLQLTRDSDASVRAGAVEALAGRLSPEVRRRLAEMATGDKSPEVRQAASKIVPPNNEKTVALPPLPGSPALNPKAN